MRIPRLVIGLVALLVVAVLGAPAAAAPDRPRLRPMRVMTFNIHHGAGADGVVDLGQVASVILASGADVIGLQEVDRHWGERSAFVDQASRLARAVRMRVVFGANLDLDPLDPGQPRRQYGTAILTRSPILDWDNTLLPRVEGHEQRGLLRARINVRGVRVQVYNTHLQHNDAVERLAQAQAIAAHVGRVGGTAVLVGDLNTVPGTPELTALTAVLVDTWAVAGVGDGFTFPSELPAFRIDYVMTSPAVEVRAVDVVATPLAVAASDHLPVVADLGVR